MLFGICILMFIYNDLFYFLKMQYSKQLLTPVKGTFHACYLETGLALLFIQSYETLLRRC